MCLCVPSFYFLFLVGINDFVIFLYGLLIFLSHCFVLFHSIQIPKAQPSQLTGPTPANKNGGRPNNTYRGKELPKGVLVCGDHQATATLNGAVESGVNAGTEASKLLSSVLLKSKANTATKEPVAA